MSNGQKQKERIVEQEITTSASPRRVWKAWTDPDHISNWFVDRAEGEPREGTVFTWCFDEFGMEIPYQVVEADPERRFVLGFEHEQRSGLLEIDISSQGGVTKLRLVNSGFAEGESWEDEYEGIDSGWRMALALMRHYLERHYGQSKRNFMAARPSPLPIPQLPPFLRRQQHLQEWLIDSGRIGELGQACKLGLKGGRALSGRVLADSGREIQLSWDEIDGALALKCFSAGPGRPMAGLHVVSWSLSESAMQDLRKELEPILDRLSQYLSASAAGA
ncbi:MAG TPA: SRPBCC domain-containing protein [Acidobacteriota bacterium]|nr:SRPBCC domain-containing protein [Acidobacteriota bacterium]